MTEFREPPSTLVLHPQNDFDPRDSIEGSALVVASRNAYPLVAAARPRRDSLGLLAGGGIALLLGTLTFWSMSGHRAPAPESARTKAVEPSTALVTQPAIPVAVTPVPGSTGSLILPRTEPWGQVQPGLLPGAAGQPRVPVLVYDSGGVPIAQSPVGGPAAPLPVGFGSTPRSNIPDGALGENEQFASRIGAGGGNQVSTAERLSSPASTVAQGTLIAAVLETSINTDLPGYVRALVSRDVRSFDGSQVLIPRSSRLIGQYKSGLAAGQTRAYVIWTRLIRPDGVSVTLDSPGVDFSGSAGLAGQVSSHFMKRFGSALLLSVVGGLGTVASGGAGLIVGGGGQSAASVAAGRDGSIAPTIRVAQGEPIRIFTARDLDFSTVQRLEASR